MDLDDDDQDWEVSDGMFDSFTKTAENFEQIASLYASNKQIDDELLSDPVPIIPKSMQSQELASNKLF